MMIILLDRDGIINQDSLQYIKSVKEFIFLPGSIEAIARLTRAGYRIGVATNQSGIGRGYYSETILNEIHQHMLHHLRRAGGDIDVIAFCPHTPSQACWCRKPNPGLLQDIAQRMNCSLEKVPFVGDKISDLQAAKAVNAQPILIAEPGSETDLIRQTDFTQVPRFKSLADYVDTLLLSPMGSP